MPHLDVSVRPLHNLLVKGAESLTEPSPKGDVVTLVLRHIMFKLVKAFEYCLPSIIVPDDLGMMSVRSKRKMTSSPMWEGTVSTKHFRRIACAHQTPVRH
jgi:hypothetical protein